MIVEGDILDTVGFVSPIVTEPPNDTAEPLIVIALFSKSALPMLEAGKFTESPVSPIVIDDPDSYCIVFTFNILLIFYLAVHGTLLLPTKV